MKKKNKLSAIDRLALRWIATRSWISEEHGFDYLREVEQSLYGRWPDAEETFDLILVACDEIYFRTFGRGFLASVDSCSQKQAVHMHLLEPSQEIVEEVEQMRRTASGIQLSYTIDPCVAAEGLQRRNLYFNASRFVLAPLLIKRGIQRLLILDVDSLMNSSPWKQIDQLDSCTELALIRRPRKRQPQLKILASAVYYRSGKYGLKFSNAFARAILIALRSRKQLRDHVDQILPYYIMWFAGVKRRDWYSDIPARIVDYEFSPGASFWTAKGPKKHEEKFLERFSPPRP